MNWFANFIRPKIETIINNRNGGKELWKKCNKCEQMLFKSDMKKNINVCQYCGYHDYISPDERAKMLLDHLSIKKIKFPNVRSDPLGFKDVKKYKDRLKDSKNKSLSEEAIAIFKGLLGDSRVILLVMDFKFIGGSMGIAVGEAIIKASKLASIENIPMIIVTASGGARMQEGIFSLMQMSRTAAAIELLKSSGTPYIVVLTHPTTGGVSASFAMLGDVTIAEPDALICFTGPRVIQETIGKSLPKGFQTAEFQKEHGFVDAIVHRKDLKNELSKLVAIFSNNKIK